MDLSVLLVVGEAAKVLNQFLEAVMDWTWTKKLKLNPDKVEVLQQSGFQAQGLVEHHVLDVVAG